MGKGMSKRTRLLAGLGVFTLCAVAPMAWGQEEAAAEPDTAAIAMFTINNTWMLVATFLVFLMHLGFATLESGLTQAKNTVNILFKNTAIVAIGLLTYAVCGFQLMYPGEFNVISGVFGIHALGISLPADYTAIGYADGAYTYWTDFLFQGMFAATAATIVSGAVAERVKLGSFLVFSTIYVGIVYPIAGSWKWGGGFLDGLGFYDFAGSTLVHSVGGWAALVCVLILGARYGKYSPYGRKAISGHSMPLATIGVFLLWLGWFGFNGGSVLSADAEVVSYVFVTTALAAAAGILFAMLASWVMQKKPDLSMALNGALAGLVGITAGADSVSVLSAIIIGAIAGLLVVVSVLTVERAKIDDPVGAISVHLVCGVWGTLAVGLFATADALAGWEMTRVESIIAQLAGIGAYAAFCIVTAGLIFGALKLTIGVRVSEEEEILGLDIGEHGMEAYGGFQIFNTN